MRTSRFGAVLLLVTFPTQAFAQGVARTPAAPSVFSSDAIARALARTMPPIGPLVTQGKNDWTRVVQLRPGTDFVVTVTGGEQVSRVFVHADDTTLTVLRVNESLPLPIVSALRDMATREPQRLMSLTREGSWTDNYNNIRIGADGVFASGRRLGALSDFVVRIDRVDVAEITKGHRRSGFRYAGVFLLGWLGGSFIGQTLMSKFGDPSNLSGLFWGGLAGGVGLVTLTALRGPSVIYRR